MRASRARVFVETAPVDGLGAEVEAALNLDAIDVEAVARLDVGSLLALEIGVFDGVDLVGARGQIPGGGAGGVDARLADRREGADRLRHHARRRGRDEVLGDQLLGLQLQRGGHDQEGGTDVQHRLLVEAGLQRHRGARRTHRIDGQRRAGAREVLVVGVEQRRPVGHRRVRGDDAPDDIAFQLGDRVSVHRRGAGTIAELAEREGIAAPYLSRTLRLTLLAPDIIDAILSGEQRKQVTLEALRAPFPAVWGQQDTFRGT